MILLHMPVSLPFTQVVLPLIILNMYLDIVVLLEIHWITNNLRKFSTKDNDNDECSYNYAVQRIGAWWCSYSSLNGKYGDDGQAFFGLGLKVGNILYHLLR